MPEPIFYPEWDTNDTLSTQPPLAYRQDGWSAPAGVGENPPLNYFNWWQNNVYEWTVWLNDKYKPANAELLIINDGTTVTPGAAYIGAEYQGSQYYGNLAVGAQYYGNEAVGDQYYGRLADGDQFYGGTAAGAQYYGSNAIGAQYYGKDATGDQLYGNFATGAQTYGSSAIGDQYYGVNASGSQYYGEGASGNQFYGLNATGSQTYGQGATGGITIGTGATGAIDIGSAVGISSTRRLIEGANSATFAEIISAAVAEAWIIPTLTAGWTNVAGDEIQYRYLYNRTQLQIKGSATYSSGSLTLYTAAAAERPLIDRLDTLVRFGAAQTSEPVRFSAAGAVTVIVPPTAADVVYFNSIIPLD